MNIYLLRLIITLTFPFAFFGSLIYCIYDAFIETVDDFKYLWKG